MVKEYKITDYSFRKARELGVELRQAINAHKKIGVYKDGEHLVDIGAKNYLDYPQYMELERQGKVPKGHAADRRRLYKIRHKYNTGLASFFANKILW
jgi:hypothetical protein